MAIRASLRASRSLQATARVLCTLQALRPVSSFATGSSLLPASRLLAAPVCRRPVYSSTRLVCSAAAPTMAEVSGNPLITVSPRLIRRSVALARRAAASPLLPPPPAALCTHYRQPPPPPPAQQQDSPFPAYSEVKAEHVVPGIRALLADLHAEVGGA